MNHGDALNLAERVHRCWPKARLDLDTWVEVLEELQHAPAESALRTLRDSEETAPSIAKFRATYRSQFGTAHEHKIDCARCGGDGWETVTVGPTEYNTVVRPCTCQNGRRVEDAHRRIVDHNDAELARLGRGPSSDTAPKPEWITGRPQPQQMEF